MGANVVAELLIETELPIMMTVADVAIPKGTILQLTTPFTASASGATTDEFGGIAAEEKISGDGKLQIAVYRGGYFKCEAGAGGVTVGLPVNIVALNNFKNTDADDSDLGQNFGTAMETAADTQFFILHLGRA